MDLGSLKEGLIKKNAKKIQSIVKSSKLLHSNYPLLLEENTNPMFPKKALYVSFLLNKETFCTGMYMVNTSQELTCNIPSAYSDLGNRTGTFLLHLQVLLAIVLDCKEITLDNFTDDPARAADVGGIYEMFSIDKRGHSTADFTGKDLEEKLLTSEGEMRFIIDTNSMINWKRKMLQMTEKINDTQMPWNSPIKSNMNNFITLVENAPFVGGRKRRKKRKSKTQKKRHRKFYKKNTKKSQKKQQKTRKRKAKTKMQK